MACHRHVTAAKLVLCVYGVVLSSSVLLLLWHHRAVQTIPDLMASAKAQISEQQELLPIRKLAEKDKLVSAQRHFKRYHVGDFDLAQLSTRTVWIDEEVTRSESFLSKLNRLLSMVFASESSSSKMKRLLKAIFAETDLDTSVQQQSVHARNFTKDHAYAFLVGSVQLKPPHRLTDKKYNVYGSDCAIELRRLYRRCILHSVVDCVLKPGNRATPASYCEAMEDSIRSVIDNADSTSPFREKRGYLCTCLPHTLKRVISVHAKWEVKNTMYIGENPSDIQWRHGENNTRAWNAKYTTLTAPGPGTTQSQSNTITARVHPLSMSLLKPRLEQAYKEAMSDDQHAEQQVSLLGGSLKLQAGETVDHKSNSVLSRPRSNDLSCMRDRPPEEHAMYEDAYKHRSTIECNPCGPDQTLWVEKLIPCESTTRVMTTRDRGRWKVFRPFGYDLTGVCPAASEPLTMFLCLLTQQPVPVPHAIAAVEAFALARTRRVDASNTLISAYAYHDTLSQSLLHHKGRLELCQQLVAALTANVYEYGRTEQRNTRPSEQRFAAIAGIVFLSTVYLIAYCVVYLRAQQPRPQQPKPRPQQPQPRPQQPQPRPQQPQPRPQQPQPRPQQPQPRPQQPQPRPQQPQPRPQQPQPRPQQPQPRPQQGRRRPRPGNNAGMPRRVRPRPNGRPPQQPQPPNVQKMADAPLQDLLRHNPSLGQPFHDYRVAGYCAALSNSFLANTNLNEPTLRARVHVVHRWMAPVLNPNPWHLQGFAQFNCLCAPHSDFMNHNNPMPCFSHIHIAQNLSDARHNMVLVHELYHVFVHYYNRINTVHRDPHNREHHPPSAEGICELGAFLAQCWNPINSRWQITGAAHDRVNTAFDALRDLGRPIPPWGNNESLRGLLRRLPAQNELRQLANRAGENDIKYNLYFLLHLRRLLDLDPRTPFADVVCNIIA